MSDISRRGLLAGAAATALTALTARAASAHHSPVTTNPVWAAPFQTADGFAGTSVPSALSGSSTVPRCAVTTMTRFG